MAKRERVQLVWEKYFLLVNEYRLEYGGRFPTQGVVYKGVNVGNWVKLVREVYVNGEVLDDGSIKYGKNVLSKSEIEKLNAIGFKWKSDTHDLNWKMMYELLKEYLEVNGRYPKAREVYKNENLGDWVVRQRNIRNNGVKIEDGSFKYMGFVLSSEKIALLDSIGFIWSPYEEKWLYNFELFCEYTKEYDVYPAQSVEYKGVKLGCWVNTQRRIFLDGIVCFDGSIKHKSLGSLKRYQIELLESINFKWVNDENLFYRKVIKDRKQVYGIERYLLSKYKDVLNNARSVSEVSLLLKKSFLEGVSNEC